MYPPALFNLAIIRTGKGDTTEAISLYWKAITVNGDDAAAHLNLGLLLKETGDAAGGDAEINKALELNPELKQ
jgi:Flp pilus assembly protein TadD